MPAEARHAHPDRARLYVDMYGDGIARDLEPTVEDGGALWNVFASCMRVFKSGAAACTPAWPS